VAFPLTWAGPLERRDFFRAERIRCSEVGFAQSASRDGLYALLRPAGRPAARTQVFAASNAGSPERRCACFLHVAISSGLRTPDVGTECDLQVRTCFGQAGRPALTPRKGRLTAARLGPVVRKLEVSEKTFASFFFKSFRLRCSSRIFYNCSPRTKTTPNVPPAELAETASARMIFFFFFTRTAAAVGRLRGLCELGWGFVVRVATVLL